MVSIMQSIEINLEQIRSFLRNTTIAWKDSPIAQYNQLILEQGKSFSEIIPSKSIEAAKAWKKARRPKAKQCFYNSQMFVIVEEAGEYYEGYCFDGLIPFHHAWVVVGGKVLDFTLEARDSLLKRKKIQNQASNPVYLGVSVPKRKIMENVVKVGVAEPLAQKYYLNSEMRFF